MEDIQQTENFQAAPRKKLFLKRRLEKSDLTKALTLYQPLDKARFGRNLAHSSSTNNTPKVEKAQRQSQSTDLKDSAISSFKLLTRRFSFLFLVLLVCVIYFGYNAISEGIKKCELNSLAFNPEVLQKQLQHNLYGQPIASHLILNELREMQITVEHLSILILLGGSGIGKTWTTHLIEEALPSHVQQLNLHLEPWTSKEKVEHIFESIKCCSWNFIFIEGSDYAGGQQIEMLVDILNHINANSSCYQRKVVVMLTSNYGQKELALQLYEEVQVIGSLSRFSSTRLQETLHKVTSPLIAALKDRKIPFTLVPYLPLGKAEVKRCILHDMAVKKRSASQEVIQNIMRDIRFLPPHLEYFAASGCKSVSNQVNLHSEL